MRVLASFLVLIAISTQVFSQCVSKEITFLDRTRACLEQFEPLTLSSSGPSIAEQSKGKKTFAYAIPEPGSKCLATSGWSWDSSTGNDDKRAMDFCERSATKRAQDQGMPAYANCRCKVLVPVNGNVQMPQSEFVAALFNNAYGLIDQMRVNNPVIASALEGTKKELAKKEQIHYQRLGARTDTVTRGVKSTVAELTEPIENAAAEPTEIGQQRVPEKASRSSAPTENKNNVEESSRQTPISLSQLKATCTTKQFLNVGIGLEGILNDLEERRFDLATRTTEGLAKHQMTAPERNCLNSLRAAIPVLKDQSMQAEVRKRVSDIDTNYTVSIGSTKCIGEPAKDASPNSSFKGMVAAYEKGNFEDARRAANDVLLYDRQSATQSQVACAEKVLAAISSEQNIKAQIPTNQLRDLYISFIVIQACYESRKEFRVQYVTLQVMNTARAVTRRDEQNILAKHPELTKQKEAIWDQAKREYGSTVLAQSMGLSGTSHNSYASQQCKLTAMGFTSDSRYRDQQIKKDF